MAETIKIKKGLNINLIGEASKAVSLHKAGEFAVKPTDFIGVFPRLMVKEGDKVKAGTPLFHDKFREQVNFASPVSGTIKEIRRGDRRVLEEIVIIADETVEFHDFGKLDLATIDRNTLIGHMMKSGLWPMIRQRPYSVIANPDISPKAIFVSGFDSSPLAPDLSFILKEDLIAFKSGMAVLGKLTEGKIHLGLPDGRNELAGIKGVETTFFNGPHPSGNVGIQIHKLNPINKGEVVWIVNAQDVAIIGRFFTEGKYDTTMVIALTGSEVKNPAYYKVFKGTSVKELLMNNLLSNNVRCISGNVLTGTKIRVDGFLGFYHHQISIIPEGNHHEFFGWAMPGFGKFSFSKTFFSYLSPSRKYSIDTNLHGGERALVMTGQYEQVFPMDILPMQLIKACIIEDVELMEKLGIYEVDEEDFALVEFIDTSKTNIQKIIRQGLDLIRKEMS
jgi:Na+-transporting NADH:ubiquinone oxidoreductase subunit A